MIDIEKIRKTKPMKELLNFSIINIDKPTGPTSFSVSHFVKNALRITKTSHFGTLDPQVTGVLPIALGRACKLNEYFMHRDKTYVGIMRLHKEIPEKKLREEIEKFIGKITQLPPIRSRVKREERIREVKSFEILEIDKNSKDILFKTKVEAGTYIRKLIHDLGESKDIGGAHMLELRRTEAGLFKEPSTTMYEFEKAVQEYKNGNESPLRSILIPAEIITELIPEVQISERNIRQILTGKPLFASDIKNLKSFPIEGSFAAFIEDRFIGCYIVEKKGDIVAKANFVFN